MESLLWYLNYLAMLGDRTESGLHNDQYSKMSLIERQGFSFVGNI